MTDHESKYWAFLSYSQHDNRENRAETPEVSHLCWGDLLHEALESFSVPSEFAGRTNARGEIIPERIHPIFQDDQEMSGDASLSPEIRKALEQSKCLIAICSPRSAKSLHVNEAVRYFKQLGRDEHILPIVVAGEPNASDGEKPGFSPEDECFVPAIRHPVQPDGTLELTRRASRYAFVDARHGIDKREILAKDHRNAEADLEMAKIQLIALLMGVGFNVLWSREQKRHFIDLAEAQHQAREAQNKVLEIQTLSRDVPGLIQEAQTKAAEAQKQLQELQNRHRDTQSQLEEARKQVLAAESKFLEAQNQARESQLQVEETRRQLQAATNRAQALPGEIQEAQRQTEKAHHLAQEAQAQALQAQTQLQESQRQLRETSDHVKAAAREIKEAQQQAEESRRLAQEAQSHARESQATVQQVRTQSEEAQRRVQEAQNQVQQGRRLTRALALVTLIALLAASVAWWQRKLASQTLAKSVFEDSSQSSDLPQGNLDQEQIRQALQKYDAAWSDKRRLQSLDELAARIQLEDIPEALKTSSIIVDDRQRSRFQKQLLLRLGGVNPLSAMACASAIDGKIVNDDGLGDSNLFFQLAVLDNWKNTDLPGAFGWVRQLPDPDSRQRALGKITPALATNNPTNTLALLSDLNPAPGESSYTPLFQRWATNDPLQAIQLRQQLPGQDADDQILQAILAAWVEKQPDAALNWLNAQPDSGSKNELLATCVGELAKTDVSKALAFAESLPEGNWRTTLIAGLFNDWAAKDLESATTACQQLPDSFAKAKAWEYVLNQRIAKDPASAAKDVYALPPGDYRQIAIEQLCRDWSDIDATDALTWAQSLSVEPERVSAVNQVVANWAGKDPQSVIQFANQHPELSGDALAGIAQAWSKTNLTAATNWVDNLQDGPKKDAVLLALAGSTSASYPKVAAQCCTLLTTTQPMTNLVQNIAASFAKDDLSNAVAWACSLKDDPTRQAALSALSETWAQTEPKDMAIYALALPAGDARTQYLTAACRQLAIADLPGTVELLKPLSDAELRQNILAQAGRSCDLPHMNQAANYIAAMPPGDDQKAVIKGLLSNWAPADPETALNWLSGFPENNPQTEEMQPIVKAWAQSAPAEAARWLATLPAGAAREGTVTAFLEGAAQKYPEFAGQWTKSLTNDVQRQQYQLLIARQWMKTNPSSASNWLSSLDLPDEIKQLK